MLRLCSTYESSKVALRLESLVSIYGSKSHLPKVKNRIRRRAIRDPGPRVGFHQLLATFWTRTAQYKRFVCCRLSLSLLSAAVSAALLV